MLFIDHSTTSGQRTLLYMLGGPVVHSATVNYTQERQQIHLKSFIKDTWSSGKMIFQKPLEF